MHKARLRFVDGEHHTHTLSAPLKSHAKLFVEILVHRRGLRIKTITSGIEGYAAHLMP